MNKIKFSALFVVLFATFSLTSCSSDDNSNDPNEEPIETSTGDFWPMALNNSWTMSTMGTESTVKIIGVDNFGGSNYYRLSSANPIGGDVPDDFEYKQWIAKKGASYIQKMGDIEFSEDGISAKINGYEMVVLKDNLAVGETWSNTIDASAEYNIFGEVLKMDYTIKYSGTILEKGKSVTVNGKLYSNVIKMNLTQEVTVEGDKEVVESDYWYAEGVGPVKYTTTNEGETIETILIDYIINK